MERPRSIAKRLLGRLFRRIARIEPARDSSGALVEERPHDRYARAAEKALHAHGAGPFCRFQIPRQPLEPGVYCLTVADNVVYVGECLDLIVRFNAGYGIISPRNCYSGGQLTNCKVNRLILEEVRAERDVVLWFHATADRKALEEELRAQLRPPWNSR